MENIKELLTGKAFIHKDVGTIDFISNKEFILMNGKVHHINYELYHKGSELEMSLNIPLKHHHKRYEVEVYLKKYKLIFKTSNNKTYTFSKLYRSADLDF